MTDPVLIPGLVALIDPETGRFPDALAPASVALDKAAAAEAAAAAADSLILVAADLTASTAAKNTALQAVVDAGTARDQAVVAATAAALPTVTQINNAITAADIPGQVATVNAPDSAALAGAITAIPGQVTAAVAAAPTVVTAATSAVTAVADGLDLVLGADTHVVQDFDDRTGYLFAVVDSGDHLALGVRADGTLDVMKPGVGAGAGGVADGAVTLPKLEAVLASRIPADILTTDIACWGDSLTAGTGSTGANNYPALLAGITGHTVWNGGVGGETSRRIAARQGGMPCLVVPKTGGVIPASGGVAVDLTYADTGAAGLVLSGSIGTVAGITGTVTGTSGNWTFTRTVDGSLVPVSSPQPFYLTSAKARRGDIDIFWYGRNDVYAGTDPMGAVRSVAHSVLYSLNPRFLVLSVFHGPADVAQTLTNVAAVNTEQAYRYGRRYVDIYGYLVAYGLADAGITPTAQDTSDIAAGLVPTSLRNDTVHLNNAGYLVVAQQLAARLTELGWI